MCEIMSLFLFSFAIPFGFLMIKSLISVKSPSRAQTVYLPLGFQCGLNGNNLCYSVWCSLITVVITDPRNLEGIHKISVAI